MPLKKFKLEEFVGELPQAVLGLYRKITDDFLKSGHKQVIVTVDGMEPKKVYKSLIWHIRHNKPPVILTMRQGVVYLVRKDAV